MSVFLVLLSRLNAPPVAMFLEQVFNEIPLFFGGFRFVAKTERSEVVVLAAFEQERGRVEGLQCLQRKHVNLAGNLLQKPLS